MLLMSCCHVVSCRSSGSRVRNCKFFNEGTCPRQSSMQQKAWLILPVVICLSHWLKKELEVRFLPGPPNSPEPRRVQPTKKWPRKKRMASWARQRQQITEAADGGARRADGQLIRAGQRYYSHLGLQSTSTTTSPLCARGPTTTSCCATGGRSLCAPCRAESTG